MAQLNGVNYALTQLVPASKIGINELGSDVKVLKEKYVFSGDAGVSVSDEILGPSLPGNCMVVDASLRIDGSLGTAGIFSLGHKASTDLDGDAIAEDPDAFVDSIDGGGQAAFARMGDDAANLEAGYGLKFGGSAQVFATCTEAPDSEDAQIIEWMIFYVEL